MLSVGAAAACGSAAACVARPTIRRPSRHEQRHDRSARRRRAAQRDDVAAVSPWTAPRPVSASADTQSGCGTPPCRQGDGAVDSSASARRARACPSVEAGVVFMAPGSREPLSSNAGPHHTEPSFTHYPVNPQTELSRRSRLPKPKTGKLLAVTGFLGLAQACLKNHSCRPPGPPRAAQQPYTSKH